MPPVRFPAPLLLPVLPALLLVGCNAPSTSPDGPETVTVEILRPQPVAAGAHGYDGIVRPRHTLVLGFKQGGRIAALRVEIGDHVRAGQVLASLDRADSMAVVDQLAGDQAAAAAALAQAREAAERAKGLDADGALAASEVRDRALAAASASGKARAAAAALRGAKAQWADGVLRAPQDGIVTDITLRAGMVAGPGTAVITIASGTPEVEVNLPEGTPIQPGMTAGVTLAGASAPLPATLRLVEPAADPATRQRKAYFTLPAAAVAPFNTGATLTLGSSGATGEARIPLTALDIGKAGVRVWLLRPDHRHVRPLAVRLVALRGADAIISGLPAGQSIVAGGLDALRADSLVTPLPAPEIR